MRLNKNLLYLLTLLEAIEKIRLYTQDFSSSEIFFEANAQKEFNATLNLLIAIGEETKKLGADLKSKAPEINWGAITGLRNELSHNYRGVDPDIIWDIVQNLLEPLKDACITFLKETLSDKIYLFKLLESPYYRNIQYLKDTL